MSIKRNITITLLALFLSPLLAACGGDVDEGTSGVGSLGVNTDLGNRTNPAGEELAEDYHPLSKAFRTIAPLSELYFAGLDYNGTTQGLLDDSQADWAELFSEDDGSWAQLALCSGSGDVDGDGYDEIVVLYHVPAEQVVKLKVIDRDGDAYSQRVTTVLTGVEAPSAHVLAQLFPGIANLTLGDIDGDGKDEIAFGLGNQLYLLDDASTGFVVKEQKSYPLGDANELSILRLGFGDFNGDGRDQLFVTHSQFNPDSSQGFVEWHRYDTSLNEESAGGQLTLRVGYDTKVFAIASSAVGDIDGDGLAEVVFNGLTLTSGNYTFVMDDQRSGGELRAYTQHANLTSVRVALLDADGDGVKEILSGDRLYKYNKNTGELTAKEGAVPVVALHDIHAVGDFDGDFREEVALYVGFAIQIYGLDQTGKLALSESLATAGAVSTQPTLVAANVDNDSLILRYTGEQELLFTQPQVIAVMAAPPAYANLNVDGSGTTFGRMTGSEVETSNSFGFSVGFSVGYEQDVSLFGINLGGFEVKASVETAMNWTATKSAAFETSYAYSSGPGEDKVVFTCIPYDVYYYTVVSAPDAGAIDTVISISVPREPQTISVSRSYYNANNGDAMDIDEGVLSHKIGDPWSYPNRTRRDELMSGGGWINHDMVTVGTGSGDVQVTISTTEGKGQGFSLDVDATIETEVSVGGAKVGASAGFQYGHEYSLTAYEGLFLEGTIGDIPGEALADHPRYQAGIFGYPHTAANGQTFLVVNYWVAE